MGYIWKEIDGEEDSASEALKLLLKVAISRNHLLNALMHQRYQMSE